MIIITSRNLIGIAFKESIHYFCCKRNYHKKITNPKKYLMYSTEQELVNRPIELILNRKKNKQQDIELGPLEREIIKKKIRELDRYIFDDLINKK